MITELQGRLDLRPSARMLPVDLIERRVQVFLDGDRLAGVVGLDTWRGWVDVKRRDDRGNLVTLKGRVQIQRRHGRVRAVIARATPEDLGCVAAAGLVVG